MPDRPVWHFGDQTLIGCFTLLHPESGCRHANAAEKLKHFNFWEICLAAIHVNVLARGRGQCHALYVDFVVNRVALSRLV